MKAIYSLFSIPLFGASLLGQEPIKVNLKDEGRVFEGIGALSAGASSKLLMDYPDNVRSHILDYLFKPNFGASLHQLKVEIGGDVNSTDGTEPSHAHTRAEFLNPQEQYFKRGYEWMLLKEAKKRNPAIFLDCLEWGCPGWIGEGKFYSQDNVDYIISFLKGAKQYHGIEFDYTGIWNERPYNIAWTKLLRQNLNKNGFENVKIVAADVFDWKIADDMKNDQELNDAVYAMGIHYNERWEKDPYSSTDVAKSLNKPIRNSEAGPWKGDWDGFEYLVKLYNRNYIIGKGTNVVTWSLITSYYDNLSLPNSGLMIGKTPWSGNYEVQPGIWAVAHTTQFAQPGWKYVDSGCGLIDKGSYVTLKSPDNKDFSIIIETVDHLDAQTATFQIAGDFNGKKLQVWKSTRDQCEFEKQPAIKVENNQFTIKLDGKSAYSITTTTGQLKGAHPIPTAKAFPFPYKADFENQALDQLPEYFLDQGGVFEVHNRIDGQGKCLKQVVTQQGIEWEVGQNQFVSSVIGDVNWADYEVKFDVSISEDTGYARIMGRLNDVKRGGDHPDGYWFQINTSGIWGLFAGSHKICSGTTPFPAFTWHKLAMKFKGDSVQVSLNGNNLITINDAKFARGVAGIGAHYNTVEFDNFEVK